MKLLSKCEICRKKKFLIMKRTYTHKKAELITTKDEICCKCKKNIMKALGADPSNQ